MDAWAPIKRLCFWGFGLSWAQLNPYSLAQRHTAERAWDKALSSWRHLLLLERDSVRRALIYQQMGYIALLAGDSAEALTLWHRSLNYNPTYRTAWLNYIWLRQRYRPPRALPEAPLLYRYEALPPPSESAPPHLGHSPPNGAQPLVWLPALRLAK